MRNRESTGSYVGDGTLKERTGSVDGGFVELRGERFYRIRGYDLMPPFLMNVVSSSDTWMFLSSSGGITAGRRTSDSAVFPYYSGDRVSENNGNTGPLTIIRVNDGGRDQVWEPFSSRCEGRFLFERSLYKNVLGTEVIFEEVNLDLQLTFRYRWTSSERFGFVRTSLLANDSGSKREVQVLDGLQNILPYGVTAATQSRMSNLLDAYKRAELVHDSGMAIFALSSTLTDLAEPSESLLATVAFQCGLEQPVVLLSGAQLGSFRNGETVTTEREVRGVRGSFFVCDTVTLQPSAARTWKLVCDVEKDARDLVALLNLIRRDPVAAEAEVDADVTQSDRLLRQIVAGADGLQSTGDDLASVHHLSNVLFNVLRGGTFPGGYSVQRADLIDFVHTRNRSVASAAEPFFAKLPDTVTRQELNRRAAETGDADLERLCEEYLPLAFSRRHGDPSRPWNMFSINVRNPDGTRRFDYQGNWRDIFQNWEALAWSYPEYLEGMIFRFVNASTADGYNPYRLTRDGLEWEVPDPTSPWSNIGYWGDHQAIYLLKLLETLHRFSPGRIPAILSRKLFTYANIPYRIRSYDQILEDWYNTIIFDESLHERIEKAVDTVGTDARLLQDAAGKAMHVTFAEKLLVLLLAKLANLVPDGGIWMNTQRPEWNDANNALTGKGLSVVTTAYLRRFISFAQHILNSAGGSFSVSTEVVEFFVAVESTLASHAADLDEGFTDVKRREMVDALGRTASDYRWTIYEHGFSGESSELQAEQLVSFLDLAKRFVEHTIERNRRPDGLYHSYNTLTLHKGRAGIGQLYEMLEGQVAVLSSGMLSAKQSLDLLEALRESRMYRADQHSYLLYPDRDLPPFLERNIIPAEQAERLRLVRELVGKHDESLVVQDEDGRYHFNGRFRNWKDVSSVLDRLTTRYPELVAEERDAVLELFESVFKHNSFTGRSGTFFAYEGLGSIYWHMVSKLLVAVQETLDRAAGDNEDEQMTGRLRDLYYDIRAGLGFNKRPEVYGAFPTDPYSHTPSGRGAKQPGMTGQVKEEILTRLRELGILVEDGCIVFQPRLLRLQEFVSDAHEFVYVDVDGKDVSLQVPPESFVFTFCQVPVIVRASDDERITVELTTSEHRVISGHRVDEATSRHIFIRDGSVRSLCIETVRPSE